jgi:hypothetical protein
MKRLPFMIKKDATDYTLYQKAMALGFKGDTQAKITNLKNFYQNIRILNIMMMLNMK